ncbi:type I 3-dehydroquinate dehydratase [Gemmiger sp.]
MPNLRGLTLDAACPRIIVPLFAHSLDALRPLAEAACADPAADIVELRLDPLPEADFSAALALVHGLTGKPLIATIRTAAEGGELALTPDAYAAHCRALLAEGGVDVLDIEWKACGAYRGELRDAARAAGAAALFSEHHFDETPATDEMTRTLIGMADAGADIAKLAVMPRSAADAARLLEATARAAEACPNTPLITMSMGPIGAVTRFCGGAFGSVATFGVTSGTTASAPGQPAAGVLREKLYVRE